MTRLEDPVNKFPNNAPAFTFPMGQSNYPIR